MSTSYEIALMCHRTPLMIKSYFKIIQNDEEALLQV